MGFAMAWSAAGWGGAWAGLVLTAIVVPRGLLLLVGGAVADRIGAWQVMIAADVAMAGVTLSLALVAWRITDHPAVLVAAALVIGIADAFYLPSTGSMPRRLVTPAHLTRAASARQLAGQLAAFAGPALGGVLVSADGLPLAAVINAATFVGMAAVLLLIRPRSSIVAPEARRRQRVRLASALVSQRASFSMQDASMLKEKAEGQGQGRSSAEVEEKSSEGRREIRDGLRVAFSDLVMRRALLLTAVAAFFLLPVTSSLIPILAHQRHWPATEAGLIAGMIALVSAFIALLVLKTGKRPNLTHGLLLAAAGALGLGLARHPFPAIAAAVIIGAGVGMFATGIAPLLLARAPETHLARMQAIVVWVQSVPLLLAHTVLGSLTDVVGAGAVLVGCAVLLTISIFTVGPV